MEEKNTLEETEIFNAWHDALTDLVGKHLITRRIKQARGGNFGVVESVGEGVYEMKIDYGPGYRLYFFQESRRLYRLLAGGDKDAQSEDGRWPSSAESKGAKNADAQGRHTSHHRQHHR